MRKWLSVSLLALAVTGPTLSAHHSFAMFEMDKNITYKGKVIEWKWQNPHTHFTVNVAPGPGVDPQTVGTWDVEGGSVNIMARQGWTRASYKAGDDITLVGHPMKDGSKGISLFYAIRRTAPACTTTSRGRRTTRRKTRNRSPAARDATKVRTRPPG